MNNFKYWIIGTIITSISTACILRMLLSINQIDYPPLISLIIYIIPFFFGGLIIKFIKLDMPVYYYATVGVIYHTGLFFLMTDGKELHFSENFSYPFWIILSGIIIASAAGGGMVELIKYIKK